MKVLYFTLLALYFVPLTVGAMQQSDSELTSIYNNSGQLALVVYLSQKNCYTTQVMFPGGKFNVGSKIPISSVTIEGIAVMANNILYRIAVNESTGYLQMSQLTWDAPAETHRFKVLANIRPPLPSQVDLSLMNDTAKLKAHTPEK